MKAIPPSFSLVSKSRGFSLVETLITLGIMSLASLAISQLVMNLLTAQRGIAIDSRLQDILNESRMSFKNPTQCSANIANFSSKNLSPSNMSTLKITVSKWTLNGNDFLTNGGPIPGGSGDSKVNLSIENFQEVSTDEYKASAVFKFERGNVPGGSTRTRQLPINLITTSGVITSCSFSSIEMLSKHDLDLIKSDICASLGGTYDFSTEKCSLNSSITSQIAAMGTCPSGYVATGVDSLGKITCTPQSGGTSLGGSSTSMASTSNCSGGSFSKTSPNGTNSCFYTYPAAGPYQTVTGTATSGSIAGTCQPDGTWQYSYICPDKTGATCEGGSRTWYSLSGKTACTCSFDQATDGQSRTGSCNTGSVSGTCTVGGWSYNVSCKDPSVITCSGGTEIIGSSSTTGKTCNCVYNTSAAGQSVSVPCTNGGTLRGICTETGQWANVVRTCP